MCVQALNNLQSACVGFGFVNAENVFEVSIPHPPIPHTHTHTYASCTHTHTCTHHAHADMYVENVHISKFSCTHDETVYDEVPE